MAIDIMIMTRKDQNHDLYIMMTVALTFNNDGLGEWPNNIAV